MKIGIIGLGTVGETIYKVLSLFHEEVKGYDINPKISKNSFPDILKTNIVFLCLPTPLNNNTKRLDCSLISDYLKKLDERQYTGLIVIKSTLSLGFLKNVRLMPLRIIYSPEFLHEKTSLQEFINPKFILVTGSEDDYFRLRKVFYWVPPKKIYRVNDRTAEITKLTMNAFASTKISFVNEIESVCKQHKVNPSIVMDFLRLNGRCAEEYSQTGLGPFRGSCLQKDTEDLAHSSKNVCLLKAVLKINEMVKKGVI